MLSSLTERFNLGSTLPAGAATPQIAAAFTRVESKILLDERQRNNLLGNNWKMNDNGISLPG
jgi:hypothetical protein